MSTVIRAPTPPYDDAPDGIVEGIRRLQRLWQNRCSVCSILTDTKACAGCRCEHYCSRECQRSKWPMHKNSCKDHQERFGNLAESPEQQHTWNILLWKKRFEVSLILAAYSAWKLRTDGKPLNKSGLVVRISRRTYNGSGTRFLVDGAKSLSIDEMRSLGTSDFESFFTRYDNISEEGEMYDPGCQQPMLLMITGEDEDDPSWMWRWLGVNKIFAEKAAFPLAGDQWQQNLIQEVEEDRPAMQIFFKNTEDSHRWSDVIMYMMFSGRLI